MRLRNGKQYYIDNLSSTKIININKYVNCSICSETYNSGDLICSCTLENINKHSFHKNCLNKFIEAVCNNPDYPGQTVPTGIGRCPYCFAPMMGKHMPIKIL